MGCALSIALSASTIGYLRRRVRELRAGYGRPSILQSVTRFFFVTTQFFALVWVCTSYGIAIYSTICLGQVYTMSELSEPAIQTILGVGFLKVLENVFEHNDGVVFGKSKSMSEPPDKSGGPEEGGLGYGPAPVRAASRPKRGAEEKADRVRANILR